MKGLFEFQKKHAESRENRTQSIFSSAGLFKDLLTSNEHKSQPQEAMAEKTLDMLESLREPRP